MFQIIDAFDVTTNSNSGFWTTRREKAKERNNWSFSFASAMRQVWEKQEEGSEGAKSESVPTGIKQIVGGSSGGAERLMR